MLTQLLLYVLYYLRHFDAEGGYSTTAGSSYVREEVHELAELNESNLAAIRDIVGVVSDASENDPLTLRSETATSAQLRKQGRHWAQHILEGPITWIASAIYITATVVAHRTPLSLAFDAIKDATAVSNALANETNAALRDVHLLDDSGATTDSCACANETALPSSAAPSLSYGELLWPTLDVIIAIVDAAIYIFLPIWTAWLLRLLQGRPWLHRVAGRALLIGDIPYVSQSIEAYVSKLFALSYSIASISVSSGNPTDHLVHRHTHRVVRGSLLAMGRPDGRLNGLASAENTASLSLSQASSIQNWGVTCESITIGHNPCVLEVPPTVPI